MLIRASTFSVVNSTYEVKVNCPGCGHFGTFDEFVNVHDIQAGVYFLGQRRCPDSKCGTHIFFVQSTSGAIIESFPAETIPFEREGLPERVLGVFDEAVRCHASACYMASALMLRKTLEEICLDREAKGANLKQRISALGAKIIIPKELLEAMDELRLLGNDAAHIESQAFNNVSNTEVEVGVEFTKEILKAVYQYEHLLTRFRLLKKKET